jgi:hypothetical protein
VGQAAYDAYLASQLAQFNSCTSDIECAGFKLRFLPQVKTKPLHPAQQPPLPVPQYRTTSAAVKIVPVAGDVVAYPLDKTADVID